MSPSFANFYFNLLDLEGYYETFNRGNATRFVNRKQMARIPFPICPMPEQLAMVELLSDSMAMVETVEAIQASSEAELTQLDQSILAKAFRGELVPQDSGDEPASQLLHRIRTTREQAEADEKEKKKATRKRKAKAPSQSSKGS